MRVHTYIYYTNTIYYYTDIILIFIRIEYKLKLQQ